MAPSGRPAGVPHWEDARMTNRGCGSLHGARFSGRWRRQDDAVRLCRAAQRAKREAPQFLAPICRRLLAPICRRLRESLAGFAPEGPEAKIRSRACGCPV